ncbi:MAG: tetratricopeptide repeat protein [Acetobacteraceae bacterium]
MSETGRLPYPGLRAYERDESDLFFGREGCVDEMVDRLAATRFLAVLGASGSGKSSLVRTGLLDALEIGLHATAGPLWIVADCHPGGSAFRNLAEALLTATQNTSPGSDAIDTLDTFLRRGPRAIIEWANDGNLPAKHNLLVLVDQFEELFRYGDYAGREEAEAFAALLLESIRTPGRIHVVITMRSEYLGGCALIPGLAEQINSSLYLTRRMTREECREAIEGPAAVIGFSIEPALVSHILNDMAALAPWEQDRENSQLQRLSRQADQLPLMQHALSRLWQLARRRQPSAAPTLTLQDYLDIGMLQGALDQHAKEVVGRLRETARPLVRRVFRALTAGTDLSDAVRRPMRLADLTEAVSADIADVCDVVDAFRARDCNFLRPSGGQVLSEETVIDISHESLIRQWSDLAKWFDEEARSSVLWSRLINSEERHANGEGELQSGLDLATALDWWEREQPTIGWAKSHGGKYDEIDKYLKDSREAEQKHVRSELQRARRERQRLRTTIVAISCFAVVCLVLAGFTYRSYRIQEAEHKKADQAAVEASQATATSIRAADQFVIDDAERLQKMPGIPYEEVFSRLKDGRAFLDKLAELPMDRQRFGLSQAKLLLVNGETLLDSGKPAEALSLVTDAEASLGRNVTRSDLAADRDLLLLKLGVTAISSLLDLGRYPDAVAAARQEVQWADGRPGADPSTILERAKARFYLMFALAWSKAYSEALDYAGQCLDYLKRPELAGMVERDYYSARCNMDYGVIVGRLHPKAENDQYYQRAERDFDLIPSTEKSVHMLSVESTTLSNIGATYQDSGKSDGALKYYLKAERVIELSAIDLHQNLSVRSMLVERANKLGEVYDALNDRDKADTWFRKAIDVGMADERWHDLPDMADKIDTAMGNLEHNLGNIDWTSNPAVLKEYADSIKVHVPLRQFLISSGKAAWCQGCLLLDKESEFTALIRFDRLRKEDHYREAMQLADEIVAEAKAGLVNPPNERTAINVRRAWFWTVHALPDSPEEMPSVTGLPKPTEQVNTEIERLTATRDRLAAFLKAFPAAWLAEQHLGVTYSNLAKLFAWVGRKDDAIAAAEAGAGLFDKTSIELLEGWYRTGSGPVARDLAKADSFARTLGSRRWDITHLIVHHAQPLWLNVGNEMDVDMYIEDPRFEGDDPVARSIHQIEDVQGLKLKDSIKKVLYDDLTEANQKKVSFSGLVLRDVGSAMPADEIEHRLEQSAMNNDRDAATKELITQWGLDNGEQAVRTAVMALVNDNPGRDFVPWLADVAEHAEDSGKYGLTVAIVDTLLTKQHLPTDKVVHLLELRGNARDDMGDFNGAVGDWSIALALKPDDAQTLNSLGWGWVDNDKNLDLAIDLLTRAVHLAPNDANIRDSLGWAEVKVGKTEEGLKLLQSAAAQKPDMAEIVAHLADTYRRLGRDKEASATFARAAALKKSDRVDAFIKRQQKLLDSSAAQSTAVDAVEHTQ